MIVPALISFLIILTLGLPISGYAATGAWNYVNETNATYTSKSGPYTNVTTTGYPSTNMHAYKSTSREYGQPVNSMRWKCNMSTTTNYNYHLYIAIPFNTGTLDGTYRYYARNTVSAENFYYYLNQENYANVFVYLGWTQGTGGSTNCYVETNNIKYDGDVGIREFWIDHMVFWPNLSTTHPVKTWQ